MAEVHENGEATIAFEPHGQTFDIPKNGFPDDTPGQTFDIPKNGFHAESPGQTFDGPVNGFPVDPPGQTFDGPKNGFPVDSPPSVDKKFEIPTAKLLEVKVTDYMRESLDKVASSEGFVNYDIKVDHGSAIGDGFVGLMFKATIRELDSDKVLSVLLKSPPENYVRRHDFGALALFKREVLMYNEVLPAFVKFQEERKIKAPQGFFEFPKCYFAEYSDEKEDAVIIMGDLRDSGHKMWNKFKPTDIEHTKLLMASLGRLHAVSFAMKMHTPELFEKFKELDDFMSQGKMAEGFMGMLAASIDKAADCLDPNDAKRRARVMMLKEDLFGTMKGLTNPDAAEPYAVVTHGDCWSNNFMFHYKRGTPDKIVLLDWQISRYCSPVLDLVYFLFCCTDGELRKKHYDELLNIYHRSLKDLLDHLGGDTMSQFPFTALLRQMKQFGKFGMLMAVFLIPMLSTKNEDLPDMDFIAENMDMNEKDPAKAQDMMDAFTNKNQTYETRMREALIDSIRLHYF